MKYLLFGFTCLLLLSGCNSGPQITVQDKQVQSVVPGIDVLLREEMHRVSGKRIGLITNPTGVTMNLISTIDTLHHHPEAELKALFGPEHGVRGNARCRTFCPGQD
ncbi:MAG: DUF1343 domain-containing protein [candidate division KSB1 bacterium]|nr:DUF1343 domain-containing protein [candidate division KSB1 bacterium]